MNEVVNLESTAPTTIKNLADRVPNDHGRYHLFRFPHSHEGDFLESTGIIRKTDVFTLQYNKKIFFFCDI